MWAKLSEKGARWFKTFQFETIKKGVGYTEAPSTMGIEFGTIDLECYKLIDKDNERKGDLGVYAASIYWKPIKYHPQYETLKRDFIDQYRKDNPTLPHYKATEE
jgi:hypothetical protein